MYINFKHAPSPEISLDKEWKQGMIASQVAELTEARHLRGVIDDIDLIVAQNAVYRKVMAEKAAGRPGHYYGRDIVMEGAIPMGAFIVAAQEFDSDPDWWKEDSKFQAYMKRHPEYSWTNG